MDADQLLEQLFARASHQSPEFESSLITSATNSQDDDLDPQLDYDLDYELDTLGVLQRIESCALWLVDQLLVGQLPDFHLDVSSTTPTTLVSTPSANTPSSSAISLVGRHEQSAERYARLWQVLNISHEILSADATAAQRELHYRLKATHTFKSPSHLSTAIQDAVKILRVPRSLLGIACSGKGLVAGRLVIHQASSGEVIDCAAAGGRGTLIPGDLSTIQSYTFQSDAQCIVVVEKETVFQRLVAARLFNRVPAVIVCGKGVPDLATRAFLSSLHCTFSSLPCLGLVDWNPAGISILSIYSFGSRRMVESFKYAVPLHWLGARAHMLEHLPSGSAFQELSPRDRALMAGLKCRLADAAPQWLSEIETMERSGSKAELEALYEACGGTEEFVEVLVGALQNGDWV